MTGTDGKTSTCHLIADSLTKLGKKVGIITTEGNGVYPRLKHSSYTTPRSDLLYKIFDSFRRKKVDVCVGTGWYIFIQNESTYWELYFKSI